MIIVRLIGGLGNQMFQYALGRSLALKNNTDLKLDISGLVNIKPNDSYTIRNYELNNFNISEIIANTDELNYFGRYNSNPLKQIYKLRPYYKRSFVLEQNLAFDAKILDVKDNSYLSGYWQTEKYFLYIRETILGEFTLKTQLNKTVQTIANDILKSNSVSMHIRRGDYVSTYCDYYHVLDNAYYQQALLYIRNKIKDIEVFVFSDDIDCASKYFKDEINFRFIISNKSFEDLYLMSLCKHNIIANSSFSWWGAWLNKNEDKIIIAPNKWYKNETVRNCILPDTYIKF